MEKKIRCTRCYEEFTEEESKDADCCPKCGSKGLPHLISEDVNVKISWHELRILCNWASSYADTAEGFTDDSKETLKAIVSRLMKYRPKDAAALTLEEEFKELQDHFPESTLYKGGKVLIPPKNVGKA